MLWLIDQIGLYGYGRPFGIWFRLNIVATITVALVSILYVWTIYNLPTLVTGLLHAARRKDGEEVHLDESSLPTISIIVAAKNEEKVIGRLLRSLLELRYPRSKMEIVVVEDGSSDKTAEICMSYVRSHPDLVRFYHRDESSGKPSALNYGLAVSTGEILAIFDADNVPEKDILLKVARNFEAGNVAAVQGKTRPLNRDQNSLTKITSFEETAWFRIYMTGKERLRLFVPMTGSCGFIRRKVLKSVGGWDEDSITEDVELAVRLMKEGYTVRYVPDAVSWQEYPSTLKQLFTQRARWFRGYLETAAKYGRLLFRPNPRRVDAEFTLCGPLVLSICFISYGIAISNLLNPTILTEAFVLTFLSSATVLTLTTFFICGVAVASLSKPRRLANLGWIFAVFGYWVFQSFIAFWALVELLVRRRYRWVRTEKTGVLTEPSLKSTVS